MRVDIPAVGPAYTNREKPLSAQVTKNLWPEINPEARSIVALHHTPGLKWFSTLEGIDRGFHNFNNLLYTVNGTSLYSVDADGVTSNKGAITGTNRCVFADDGDQLIITTGSTAYRYTSDGLEAITDPDLVNPTSVAYLNSQFIFDQNRGTWGEFVTSELTTGFSVNALDFAQAESHPDDIIRVLAFNQLVYFFGLHSMEPWWNSGNDRPPFDRVQGGVRPYGLAGIHAITSTQENIYFLGTDRIPRRMPGLDAQSITTPALGIEFARYNKIDDCIAFNYVQDGQYFVVFTFPTADRTWVYHEPSGSWFQWSFGVNNARARANSCINLYGLNLVADHTDGNIYELDPCTYTDNGYEIQRERDTATIHGGLYGVPGKKLYFDKVEFVVAYGECEVRGTGIGPQPLSSPQPGICGTTDDLAQGSIVLSPHGLQMCTDTAHTVNNQQVDTNGIAIDDSGIVSLTFAFCREMDPATGFPSYLIDFYDQGATSNRTFAVRMSVDGYIQIVGFNPAAVKILDVEITNNGASWADSDAHLFAVVIDLSSTSNRELWVDGTNYAEDPAYVTWNTYDDDFIQFKGAVADDMEYGIGIDTVLTRAWGVGNTSGFDGGLDAVGYICFDNACTLISAGVWDNDDLVRDPQGDFTGWFKSQPKIGFGPSLWKNAGSFGSAFEANYTVQGGGGFYNDVNIEDQQAGTVINGGAGGTVDVGEPGLPDPPTVPQSALPSPHWTYLSNSMTYNYVNPNAYTQTSFFATFGRNIEDQNNFQGTFTANRAVLINTTDADQSMVIVGSTAQYSGALVLVDASGTIEGWCSIDGTPAISGGSIAIPGDGQDHYLIMTSDTGNLTVLMWDPS